VKARLTVLEPEKSEKGVKGSLKSVTLTVLPPLLEDKPLKPVLEKVVEVMSPSMNDPSAGYKSANVPPPVGTALYSNRKIPAAVPNTEKSLTLTQDQLGRPLKETFGLKVNR